MAEHFDLGFLGSTRMELKNIFSEIQDQIPDELFETLVKTDGVRIERIVSAGHASPEGFWYDQEENEWVLLLKGSAGLMFEGDREPVVLKAGDWVDIPARTRHRVEWTDPEEKTFWLAVFY